MRFLIRIGCVVFVAVCASTLSAQAPAGSRSIWDGAFNAAQAERGRILYAGSCAHCHGGNLQGGESTALNGDKFWTDWGERPLEDLLVYVSKNMPFSEDGSLAGTLPAGTYADIVAHLLAANGFPAGKDDLSASSVRGVQIVKKGGPGELPASTLAHVVGCLAPRGADGTWRLVKGSRPVRAPSGGDKPDPNAPLGDREYALKFVLRSLTSFVGHRMSVTGLLLGDGGVEGLNVTTIDSISSNCN
jgi:mono/diheme cytochrome c family protein